MSVILRPEFPEPAASADASPDCGTPDDRSSGDSDRPATFRRIPITETPTLGQPRPRKPAIYGYDSYDLEDALHGIERALPFVLAAFRCHIENNEHVASFVDWGGFANRLTDLVADDLRGPLEKRMDEMRGDR